MSLGWKDLVATLLIALVVVVMYAKLKGWNVPLLGNWRLASLALLIIGLGTCVVVGWGSVPTQNAWTITAETLGGIAAALGIIGLIVDSQLMFIALGATLILLWVVSTLHHLFSA